MRKLIDLVFYISTRFYKHYYKDYAFIWSKGIVEICFYFNLMAIALFSSHFLFEEELNLISMIAIGVGVVVVCEIYFTEKRYEELDKKYKNDKNMERKGRLLIFYIAFSFISFLAALFIYSPPIDIT